MAVPMFKPEFQYLQTPVALHNSAPPPPPKPLGFPDWESVYKNRD